MRLTRSQLMALDRLAVLANTDHVDVSHVNKTGGSRLLRVAVNRDDGSVTRRLMAADGTLSPYA